MKIFSMVEKESVEVAKINILDYSILNFPRVTSRATCEQAYYR
jgi:hypothetical protein